MIPSLLHDTSMMDSLGLNLSPRDDYFTSSPLVTNSVMTSFPFSSSTPPILPPISIQTADGSDIRFSHAETNNDCGREMKGGFDSIHSELPFQVRLESIAAMQTPSTSSFQHKSAYTQPTNAIHIQSTPFPAMGEMNRETSHSVAVPAASPIVSEAHYQNQHSPLSQTNRFSQGGNTTFQTSSPQSTSTASRSKMISAWSVLSRHPALNTIARAHIKHLDCVMERICSTFGHIIKQRFDSLPAAESSSPSSLNHQGRLMHQIVDEVGEALCQVGIKTVEMFLARAQKEESITFNTTLVKRSTDLLFDSSTSVQQPHSAPISTSGVASRSRQPEQPVNKRRKTSSKPSVEVTNAIASFNEANGEDQEEEQHSSSDSLESSCISDCGSDSASSEWNSPNRGGRKRKRVSASPYNREKSMSILRKWLQDHLDDPYPDVSTKEILAKATGLTYAQVQHWFINSRMRYWRPMLRIKQKLLASGVKIEEAGATLSKNGKKNKKNKRSQAKTSSSSELSLKELSLVACGVQNADATIQALNAQASASASHLPNMQMALTAGIGLGNSSSTAAAAASSYSNAVSATSGAKKGKVGKENDSAASAQQLPSSLSFSSFQSHISALVPRSARSYMYLKEQNESELDPTSQQQSSTAASLSTKTTSNFASETSSRPVVSLNQRAEMIAASTLALSVAASYQTPHNYGHRSLYRGNYKSGGTKKKGQVRPTKSKK